MTRRYYLDNLRWAAILLLFPFHTAMIYNDYGENFYVRGPSIPAVTAFILATYSWFMPLLFVLAGISASLALEKRTPKEFASERLRKLLVPFISGVLLLIPVQTYFAERFHNGYTGGYFQQYLLFFTKQTDLTGYTGGFTPGHLWFLLYLFVISLLALPILLWYRNSGHKLHAEKLTVPVLTALFLIPLILAPLSVGGKSVGEDFALFLLGFFILREERVIDRLETNRRALLAAGIVLTAVGMGFHYHHIFTSGIVADVYQRLTGWVCILAIVGMAKRHFNFQNRSTTYLSKACFPIYVIHQTALITVAYCVFQVTSTPAVQIPLILAFSVALTFAAYELFRRIPPLRFLFDIKNRWNKPLMPISQFNGMKLISILNLRLRLINKKGTCLSS